MSNPETDARIIALLDRVAKSEAYKAGAWHRVIDAAKNYAMMKSFGKYVEIKNGHESVISVGLHDRDDYIKMFGDNVLRYSVDALAESAMGF